jgi:uncharacterized membrane protein YfcA
MEAHEKAWRIHRALAALAGIGAAALIAWAWFSRLPPPIPNLYGLVVLLLFLLVFHSACARGARLRRPWARWASLVDGFVMLPLLPVGTIAGGYLIANSWRTWPQGTMHARAPRGGWPSDAVRSNARLTDRR